MDEKFFSDPAAVNKAIADFTDRISYQPTGPLLEEDRGLRFTLRRAAAIGKFSRELVNAYAQRTLALFDKQEIRSVERLNWHLKQQRERIEQFYSHLDSLELRLGARIDNLSDELHGVDIATDDDELNGGRQRHERT